MDDGIRVLAHLTWEHIGEGFLIGVASAAAAALVGGLVGLVRFARKTDRERITALTELTAEVRELRHWQGHVLRWLKQASEDLGVPFPLRGDGEDDLNEWLNDRRQWHKDHENDETNGHMMAKRTGRRVGIPFPPDDDDDT